MECKEVKRKMAAFVCSNLPQHEEKILRNHIQTCHECKQMLNKFIMLKDTIKTIELNGDEIFIKNTMSRINELQQRRFTFRFRDVFNNVFKKRKWIAYATTILLILIIFGYTLGIFNIFTKPQELSAQEILLKSVTSPEEVKSYHIKGKRISYVLDDFYFIGSLGSKGECKVEKWFKAPDKFREINICSYQDNPWNRESIWEIIVSGDKFWQLDDFNGMWYLYSDYETSCWFHDVNEKEELREKILKLQEKSETYYIKDDKVAGRRVYVIDLIPGSDVKHTFYIDKETFFILGTKNYYNDKLIRENIYDFVEYNIEIAESVFEAPPDELVEEDPFTWKDEYVDSINEAEKKAGYKIPIPKYIPEGYSQDIIKIGPDEDVTFTYDPGGKIIITDKKKILYRDVFLSYIVEDDIVPFRRISISYNKPGEFFDNTSNSLYMMPREGSEREELLIDKDIRAFYKLGYISQGLGFPYKSIWIYINATMDVSKEQLIKIANSMLD